MTIWDLVIPLIPSEECETKTFFQVRTRQLDPSCKEWAGRNVILPPGKIK